VKPAYLSAVPLLLLVAGIALARLAVVRPLIGFLLYAASALLSILFTVGLLAARFGFKAPVPWWATVLAVAPAAVVVFSAIPAFRFPRINDITTDLDDPPQFAAALEIAENRSRDMSFPPDFAPLIRNAYPDLKPLRVPVEGDKDVNALFERVEGLARAQAGWNVVRADPISHTLEGTATTSLFRFKDDFVVRIRHEGNYAIIDMRSKSRDGKGDLGANARRIAEFLAKIRALPPTPP
jgi:uncharacterized protein (DUF1499 family)